MPIHTLVFVQETFKEMVPLVWIRCPFKNMRKIFLKFFGCLYRFRALPELFEVDRGSLDVQESLQPFYVVLEYLLALEMFDRPIIDWIDDFRRFLLHSALETDSIGWPTYLSTPR